MSPLSKPHVLLLYPKTGVDLGSTVAPPHALLAVAAPLLKAGLRVTLLDQRVGHITEEILRDALSPDLICVGISSMTGTQIHNALRLARMVRRLTGGRVPIVWGGAHPSTTPEQTVSDENVDIVVVGEGEETFLELVQALAGKRSLDGVRGLVYKDAGAAKRTEARALLDVEQLLPVPWELVEPERYIHKDMYLRDKNRVLDIGQTSRGCPFQCSFCSSAALRQRRWRPMSVEKSLDMIAGAVRRFRLDGIWLRDDEFYIDRRRAHRICQGIIDARLDIGFYTSGTRVDVFMSASEEEVAVLKRAGAHTLKFGAESGSQRILDLMKKGIRVEQTLAANRRCRDHGINPVFAFIVGYPTETFADIHESLRLMSRLRRENPGAQFETMTTYTALPGTPDFDMALRHGLRPPEALEGWGRWVFDDYDVEGRQIPWFDADDRRAIGNISYMSILANALGNVMSSISSRPLRLLATALARPVSFWYRKRLEHESYRFAPELPFIRALRKWLFYSSDTTVS